MMCWGNGIQCGILRCYLVDDTPMKNVLLKRIISATIAGDYAGSGGTVILYVVRVRSVPGRQIGFLV